MGTYRQLSDSELQRNVHTQQQIAKDMLLLDPTLKHWQRRLNCGIRIRKAPKAWLGSTGVIVEGVFHCGHALCCACCARKAWRWLVIFQNVVTWARRQGLTPYHLTFTFWHILGLSATVLHWIRWKAMKGFIASDTWKEYRRLSGVEWLRSRESVYN